MQALQSRIFFVRTGVRHLLSSNGRIFSTVQPPQSLTETLQRYLHKNSQTEFGRKHGFDTIKNHAGYQKQVPLATHANYREYVDRIAEYGEQNLLTSEPVEKFITTSGTTGKFKLIPCPESHFQDLMDMAALWTSIPQDKFGKIPPGDSVLFGIAPKTVKKTPAGYPYAAGTEHMFAEMIARDPHRFCSPKEVYTEAANYEHSLRLHTLFALKNRNLKNLSGLFPPNCIRFMEVIQSEWTTLLQELESGSISPDIDVTPEGKAMIEQSLGQNPERAQELRDMFPNPSDPDAFVESAQKIWKKFSYVPVACGGEMKQYLPALQRYFSPDTHFYNGIYAQSEGFYGINFWPGDPLRQDHMKLSHESVYFEFIREEDAAQTSPHVLHAGEVKQGESYELVSTAASGLCRYRTEDIVRVEGFDDEIPVISYQYRHGLVGNLCGEKVSASHLEGVIRKFMEVSERFVTDGTLSTNENSNGYILWIESKDSHLNKVTTSQARLLDERLGELNTNYQRRQAVNHIQPLRVNLCNSGTFEHCWKALEKKAANPRQQLKMPRMVGENMHPDLHEILQNNILSSA